MNKSIREKLHNLVDALSDILEEFIEKPTEEKSIEVISKPKEETHEMSSNEAQLESVPSIALENTSTSFKCGWSFTKSEKKNIKEYAKKLYKVHENDKDYGVVKQVSDIANALGYPAGLETYRKCLGEWKFVHDAKHPTKYTAKEQKEQIKDVKCLSLLGFSLQYICAATGLSKHSASLILSRCSNIFTIEQQKEVYLKYEKYLHNVASFHCMSLPWKNDKLVLNSDELVSHKDAILKEAKKLLKDNPNYTKLKLIHEVSKIVKIPITYTSYCQILKGVNLKNKDRCRDKKFDDYANRLCALGISQWYIPVALGFSSKRKVKNINAGAYTIEQLKEAYNYNPGYLDAVAEKFGIDISIVQNNNTEEPKEIVHINTNDPAADVPLKKHIWFLRKFGHMRLGELAETFNIETSKVKDIVSIGTRQFKFTNDELIKLRAKYQLV